MDLPSVSGILTLNANPVISMLVVALFGALAGLLTGFLHVKFNINKLLSGILTMTALYSVNARILGRSNVFLNNDQVYFIS